MAGMARDTVLERLLARLDRLEDEKAQAASRLAALEQELGALRAWPAAAAGAAGNAVPGDAISGAEPTSRRGLLRTGLGAAAGVGVGALLQARAGAVQAADAPQGNFGQSTFKSTTGTPTVTIKNSGTGLGLSTTNGVSLGATTVTALTASGAISAVSVNASGAVTAASVTASGTVSGNSSSGAAPAVAGTSTGGATNAAGVYGLVNGSAPAGNAAGVWGQVNYSGGAGVGVYGGHVGAGGWAIYGVAPAGFGGVFTGDQTSGSQGQGVSGTGDIGVAGNGTSTGVYGTGTGNNSTGVYATGDGIGVDAHGTNSTASAGVYATGVSEGVYALGGGTGVYGRGTDSGSLGVYGEGDTYGVSAYSSNAGNGFVGYGILAGGATAYSSGWAAYLRGSAYVDHDLHVNGTLYKAGGSFLIDHPLAPAEKYLLHSFVEAPERLNLYSGVATLDEQGRATVALPAWFEALNGAVRYQLTALGAAAPGLYIAQEVADNQFEIAGGTPGQRVSWQVSGVRQDAWAGANPLEVEQEKVGAERGAYLHPELFGATARIPRKAPPPDRPAPAAPQSPPRPVRPVPPAAR